jgi:hypothetical protein
VVWQPISERKAIEGRLVEFVWRWLATLSLHGRHAPLSVTHHMLDVLLELSEVLCGL